MSRQSHRARSLMPPLAHDSLVEAAGRMSRLLRVDTGRRAHVDGHRLLPPDSALTRAAADEALRRLEAVSPEASRTVECRYFAGLSLEEAAQALGMSVATVRRR